MPNESQGNFTRRTSNDLKHVFGSIWTNRNMRARLTKPLEDYIFLISSCAASPDIINYKRKFVTITPPIQIHYRVYD